MLVSLTAADLLRYITWTVFSLIGLWVVAQAFRRPTVGNIDAGLLFGGLASAIGLNALVHLGLLAPSRWIEVCITTVLLSMPFLLVRLMDDVAGVPPRLMRVFMVMFAAYIAIALLMPREALPAIALPLVLGLVGTLGYVAVAGLQAVRRNYGITRRRLIAVSLGTLFLALNFSAGRLPIDPEDARSLVDLFGVAAAISYYLGFAPPRWLRQVWQGPELRAFLARTAGLPQIEDPRAMLHALEQGAAAALGAPHASIGLWDSSTQVLRFPNAEAGIELPEASPLPAAQAFRIQQPLFSRDTRYDPDLDARFRLRAIARAVLAAPITVRGERVGVLAVYGPRVSLFADDDLNLVQLLAEQAAVVLESRRLAERSVRARSREQAARLKEDFLSAAAHDLKTPLTTLIVQAQQLERRAKRHPEGPSDQTGLARIVAESERLRAMVLELLDAARAEQAQLVGQRDQIDLAALVRATARRHEGERHTFVVEAPERLIGWYDLLRVEQLLANLAENAVKYSPQGGAIRVRLWQEDEHVHLTVTDQGIGIPQDDLPHLFERFHRGANVDDRRFPGWGLGLSICRRIVEQHGGQLGVTSQEGVGSTFHVMLPATSAVQETHAALHSDR